jgi:hypothetical protein
LAPTRWLEHTQTPHRHQPLTGALLGNMSYAKGVTLKCHHEKEELVWEGLVSLPWQPHYKYK